VFRKILIANRGEIAVRVMRTLREMEIPSVAVFSDVDRRSLHVRRADEAVRIGPAAARESYLAIERILDAARKTGADAIHPGYGFLSENAEFAAACEAAGIKFIGPSSDAIRKMGSKTEARKVAVAAGATVVPGTAEGMTDGAQALQFARDVGYPVMLKAVAGGGGKGMRRVDRVEDFTASFATASGEALAAFGNAAVYVEKLIERPRHIEIQVLGDEHGNLIHLGERECSIQRRHQKVIEECPSPVMAIDPGLRERMGRAAVSAAKAAGYFNAGTIEFLVDAERNFYFLEMNTRLQVEHPVTELVTGLDLVRMQIEIAAGERLALKQEQVEWRGSAIECRVYAEDPENGFFPSPGRIAQYAEPSGPGVRIDSGVYQGWTVPLDYDPMLAKLACWAGTRQHAAARLGRALSECAVLGIRTNISFLAELMKDVEFLAGELDTAFLERYFKRRLREAPEAPSEAPQGIVSEVLKAARKPLALQTRSAESRWKSMGRAELLR
jgi:acetyl-CoA carboxylase biotin carboxylase subunit